MIAGDLGVEHSRLDRRFEFVERGLECDLADDAAAIGTPFKLIKKANNESRMPSAMIGSVDLKVPNPDGPNGDELAVALHLGQADDNADKHAHRAGKSDNIRDQCKSELPDKI